MTKNNSHTPEAPLTQNQNNAMSEDPGDGQRKAFKPGSDGATPVDGPTISSVSFDEDA
jgi:hypothetical protein